MILIQAEGQPGCLWRLFVCLCEIRCNFLLISSCHGQYPWLYNKYTELETLPWNINYYWKPCHILLSISQETSSLNVTNLIFTKYMENAMSASTFWIKYVLSHFLLSFLVIVWNHQIPVGIEFYSFSYPCCKNALESWNHG